MSKSDADTGGGRRRALPSPDIATWDLRELMIVFVPALVVLGVALWLLLRLVQPSPPTSITMATGGPSGAYHGFGNRYAEVLKRSGIELRVRPTLGSIENVKLLSDARFGVDVALLQGGITNAQESPDIVSVGRAFLEPLWVFYRGAEPVDMMHQLAGRRLAIGPEGSGTRHLAMALLAANRMERGGSELLALSGQAAAEALLAGRLDAVFLAMAPESPLVQALMREPGVRLMSFSQADAYARLMPYLQRIILPKGSFDLVQNIPDRDIALIAPIAALVARKSLHPALAGLLVDAAREVHGKGGLFHRYGEFPQAADPEFDLAQDVERYYKAGPSFLKRYLPFWLATFIERMLLLAVPVAGLVIPMIRGLPMIYKWRIKRRLLHWYARLKVLEAEVAADPGGAMLARQRTELGRIEAAVRQIRVPLSFSEEYYSLRSAIDLVRQRILAHASGLHPSLT